MKALWLLQEKVTQTLIKKVAPINIPKAIHNLVAKQSLRPDWLTLTLWSDTYQLCELGHFIPSFCPLIAYFICRNENSNNIYFMELFWIFNGLMHGKYSTVPNTVHRRWVLTQGSFEEIWIPSVLCLQRASFQFVKRLLWFYKES